MAMRAEDTAHRDGGTERGRAREDGRGRHREEKLPRTMTDGRTALQVCTCDARHCILVVMQKPRKAACVSTVRIYGMATYGRCAMCVCGALECAGPQWCPGMGAYGPCKRMRHIRLSEGKCK